MPKTDGERVVADLKRLAEFGRYKTGVHRPTYSAEDVASRQWLADNITLQLGKRILPVCEIVAQIERQLAT